MTAVRLLEAALAEAEHGEVELVSRRPSHTSGAAGQFRELAPQRLQDLDVAAVLDVLESLRWTDSSHAGAVMRRRAATHVLGLSGSHRKSRLMSVRIRG